jgi:hypothetical protein
VTVNPDASAIGMTDDGHLVGFRPERGNGERLFALPDPDTSTFLPVDDAFAVARKSGLVRVLGPDGRVRGESGPWPVEPLLLAGQSGTGFLIGVKKLLVLLGPDGQERWRHHLPAPVREGMTLPGTFLVVDETGATHVVTPAGVIRAAFHVGGASVTPCPDGGEGPGFLLTEERMLSRARPDGQVDFRFRTPDDISFVRTSADGRYAGVFAGVELYVFPLVEDARELDDAPDTHRFLEIFDG